MSRMKAARQAVSQSMASMRDKLNNFKQPRNDGKALEEQVGRILSKEGFRSVELNTRVKDPNGNWSEIDVIGKDRSFFHRFFRYSRHIPFGTKSIFVECKQYSQDNRVSLGDVSKFKEVLQLNRVPLNQGLFVTTSTYVPRATTIGISTVDGHQLRKWIRQHRTISPTQQKFTHAVNIGIAFVFLVFYGSLVLDIRDARTKTMNQITAFNDKGQYEDSINQHGPDGFVVTAGLSPQERFATVLYTLQLFKYACQYTWTKAVGGDVNALQVPEKTKLPNQPQSYNSVPTSHPPKPNSLYISYELHRPLPTIQPQRDQCIDFLRKLNKKNIEKHTVLSKLPQFLTDYYSYYAFSHDYIQLNCNYDTYPLKFLPTALSKEFFQVTDPNPHNTTSTSKTKTPTSQTIIKLPVPHSLSTPGYFLPYFTYRLVQLRQLLHKIIPPPNDIVRDPSDGQVDGFISSTGSLLGHSTPTTPFTMFSERSSNNIFGDNFFNTGLHSSDATSSSSASNEFTHAMKPQELFHTADTFNSSSKHKLGRDERDTIGFFDGDSSGDDFGYDASQQYLMVGMARHEDDDRFPL